MSRRAKLTALLDELRAMQPYPWDDVAAWVTQTTPVIRALFPEHADTFTQQAKTPTHSFFGRVGGGGGFMGDPVWDNAAEMAPRERARDEEKAVAWKRGLIGTVEGILNAVPDDIAGSSPAKPSDDAVKEAAHTLNRNARALLVLLHKAHLEVHGASFSLGYSEDLPFDFPSYRAAAQRLEERGLARWAGQTDLTSTGEGVRAAEDPSILGRELPVGEVQNEGRRTPVADTKKVFVIHGRNSRAVDEMGIFLRSMGLEPLWFRDVRKEMGGTAFIAKVVERGMQQAHGVIAIFTPDEYAAMRPDLRKAGESGDAVERWQARPNVLFEAGMAYGRDPDRVAFVLFGNARLFTDASGIHVYWPTNEHDPDSARAGLRGLLARGMGCAVNMHSDDWMTAGDFDAVMTGLSGVTPNDPFRH